MIQLERITDPLPADLAELRAEARADGHGMLDTLAGEWASGETRFDRPGEMLLAAYVGDSLAGIGGITQEAVIPGALRARRFYVALPFRRLGVGRALANQLLAEARRSGTIVTCNAAAGSEGFWEALGFVPDRRDGHRHTHMLV